MVVYPIHVPRKSYKGSKPRLVEKARRYKDIARQCEMWVNNRIKEVKADPNHDQYMVFNYYEIAAALRLNIEDVKMVGYGIDAGSNEFTVNLRAAVAHKESPYPHPAVRDNLGGHDERLC